jgi:hypothetical protein
MLFSLNLKMNVWFVFSKEKMEYCINSSTRKSMSQSNKETSLPFTQNKFVE